MASDEQEGEPKPDQRRGRPVDLADIKESTSTRPSTADQEITAAIKAAKPDRVGALARGEIADTASAVLTRALVDADPLGTAIERAGLFRGSAGEQIVRDALSGRDLVSRAIGLGAIGTARDIAASGSFAGKTARELEEAQRKMSDLILGRSFADRQLASVQAAEGKIGQFTWGSQFATGRGAIAALEDFYAGLGVGRKRDRLLGYVGGVGSLAAIAAGLADPAGDMRHRASAMFAETQRRIDEQLGLGTIGGALRAGYSDLFPTMRLPRPNELDAVIEASRTFDPLKPYPDWAAEARHSFEALTTPWVRTDLPDASIAAMARLGDLGRLVEAAPPNDPELLEALRERLGDYRAGEAPDHDALDDPIVRTGYRLERGFDPVLTVLPTAILAAMYAPFRASAPTEEADPDQLENFVRMLMKRIEQALRRFLVDQLRSVHGDDWFEALPSKIRGAWMRGRQKAIDQGRKPRDLIEYADIDHYRVIIEHPDYWGRLFESVFKDQEEIRATLRRIAPIRNDGAHFRPVTPEDLIILRAEGIHLSKWLGVRLGD